jgi:hypothetical protein
MIQYILSRHRVNIWIVDNRKNPFFTLAASIALRGIEMFEWLCFEGEGSSMKHALRNPRF